MAGKFPIHPTLKDQQSLLDFITLFAQLYPCGECAAHFQLLLQRNPPKVDIINADRQ